MFKKVVSIIQCIFFVFLTCIYDVFSSHDDRTQNTTIEHRQRQERWSVQYRNNSWYCVNKDKDVQDGSLDKIAGFLANNDNILGTLTEARGIDRWIDMIDMERYKKNKNGGFDGVLSGVAEHNVRQGHCGCCVMIPWYRNGLNGWYQKAYQMQGDIFTQTNETLMQCWWNKMFDCDNKYGENDGRWAPKSVWNFKNSFYPRTECDLTTMPYSLLQEFSQVDNSMATKQGVIKAFACIVERIIKEPRCVSVVKVWEKGEESVNAVCRWDGGAGEIFNDDWIGFGHYNSGWYRTKLFKVYMKVMKQGDKIKVGSIDYGMYPCVDIGVNGTYQLI